MVTARPAPNCSRRHPVRERGTTIFIVVLVITTLTGIGLFAARMTSSVDTATGYARQSAQAQGLSLYAGQLAANVLINQGGIIKDAMEQTAATNTGYICPSNRGATDASNKNPAYCAYRSNVELTALVSNTTLTLLAAQSTTTPGSLGPIRPSVSVTGVEGSMQVEFLDVARALPQAGASMGSNTNSTETPYEFGVNAWAQVRAATTAANTNWCLSDAASTGANVQSARLYISVPRL